MIQNDNDIKQGEPKKKYYKKRHDVSPYLEVDPIVKRICLKCEKEFEARGMYNRICYACKRVSENNLS